jgi:hypothetical protein
MTPEQANPDNFSKEDFKNFVTEALKRGREIGNIYHRLFTGKEDTKALVAEIEEKLEGIKVEYQNLFSIDGTTNLTKVQTLNDQIRAIKEYHALLLIGDETNKSIKEDIAEIRGDIEDSQSKITDFYNELFDNNKPEGGKKKQIDEAILTVLDFHKELTKADGYIEATEDAYEQLVKLHEDLFITTDENKLTKAARVQKQIDNINEYNQTLEREIKVFITDTKEDIERKRKDVSLLLGSALGPTLVQGYLDSKNEYRRIPYYIEIKNKDFFSNTFFIGLIINLYRTVMSLLGIVMDYVFFVLPLLLSVLILTQGIGIIDHLNIPLNADFFKNATVIDRLLISLPLWWISLFGYKNIRVKNRLAEEYNHKAQVANMYNLFSSEEATYPIEPEIKIKLQETLIEVIGRNPSEIYGRDETVFDKISKIILSAHGVYEPETNVSNTPSTSKPAKPVTIASQSRSE